MPLPDGVAREAMIQYKMKDVKLDMSDEDKQKLTEMTEGYSCADL